jgi:hypothetical protein
MAQIIQSIVVIKVSKLVKDDGDTGSELVTTEILTNLEEVLRELVNDPTALIEITDEND